MSSLAATDAAPDAPLSFDRLRMRRFGNIASPATLMANPSNHEILSAALHRSRTAASTNMLRVDATPGIV